MEEEELQELMEAAMSMSGDLEFRDDGYIELVLRILGLMCDNQHHDIQVQQFLLFLNHVTYFHKQTPR